MAAQNGERSPILQRKKRSEGSAQGQEDGAGPSGEAGGRGQPREPEPGMSFMNEPMANGPKIFNQHKWICERVKIHIW